MKKLLTAALLMLLFLTCGNFRAWGRGTVPYAAPYTSAKSQKLNSAQTTQNLRTHAILFAVNEYQGKMNDLYGCLNDIERIRGWLTQTHSLQPNNLQILTNSRATYANLHSALSQVSQKYLDRLVVVIACHGGSAHGKSFICPSDMKSIDFSGTAGKDTVAEIRKRSLYPLADLLRWLKACRAKEILLILDSCRKVEAGNSGFMQEFQTLMTQDNSFARGNGKSLAVITSCSFGQTASEYSVDGRDYGKFLYFFTDGLTGKADFTGCYDNRITLTEAYNYAYAQMDSSQTPEIFMASSSGNMILASYADLPRPADPSTESDLAFLLRTGVLLSNIERWSEKTNRQGMSALDCVLENLPNNSLARSVRGSVHRRLGNYEEAMLDWDKVGHKFQLYAGTVANGQAAADSISLYPSPNASHPTERKLELNDLLTVSGIRGEFLLVSEVNNSPIPAAWVKRSDVYWDYRMASQRTTATQNQRARDFSNSARAAQEQRMISTMPGNAGQFSPVSARP